MYKSNEYYQKELEKVRQMKADRIRNDIVYQSKQCGEPDDYNIESEQQKILDKLNEAYDNQDKNDKTERDYDDEVMNQIIQLKQNLEAEEMKKYPKRLKTTKTIKQRREEQAR